MVKEIKMDWRYAYDCFRIVELVIFNTSAGKIVGMTTIRNPDRKMLPARASGRIEPLGGKLANFIYIK